MLLHHLCRFGNCTSHPLSQDSREIVILMSGLKGPADKTEYYCVNCVMQLCVTYTEAEWSLCFLVLLNMKVHLLITEQEMPLDVNQLL